MGAVMRLLVNDCLTAIPGTRTFWHDLQEWFGMDFIPVPFNQTFGREAILPPCLDQEGHEVLPSLIVRNASYMPPFSGQSLGGGDLSLVPTISLLQDIMTEGPGREMQESVIRTSGAAVFNSAFTFDKYSAPLGMGQMAGKSKAWVIPLPVDFSVFEPGNAMGLQQALSLPDGCICWIGACREAGPIKGWDIFLQIVRTNPDLRFVAVFKDEQPEYAPFNLRMFSRLRHKDLVRVIGACRVGLCTSRMESQHLAGIEMGACGLPLVVPNTGTYWKREDMPGQIVVATNDPVESYTRAIRAVLPVSGSQPLIRDYWQKEFGKPVVRAQWEKLVQEVECSGRS